MPRMLPRLVVLLVALRSVSLGSCAHGKDPSPALPSPRPPGGAEFPTPALRRPYVKVVRCTENPVSGCPSARGRGGESIAYSLPEAPLFRQAWVSGSPLWKSKSMKLIGGG